ncbi:MAG: MBL fold metallo-hydrolase [Planctomycetota bacterium]
MDLPDLRARIDTFSRGAGVYFLTHWHADHMRGLGPGWAHGPLYCSSITARLLTEVTGVRRDLLRLIDPGERAEIGAAGGRGTVTAFDANHCPGAVMFAFEDGRERFFYSGDCRVTGEMLAALRPFAPTDVFYVDSTYAHPRYRFPTQEEAVRTILELVTEHGDGEVYIALYTIGKNRIVAALFERFGRPTYVTKEKHLAYSAIGAGHLVTTDRSKTNFFGYSRGYFERYFRRKAGSRPLVIIPTGWAIDERDGRNGFHYIPYSEHCDYHERKELIETLRPRRIVDL